MSVLPFPSIGDLPNRGPEPGPPALQAYSLLSEPLGKPIYLVYPSANYCFFILKSILYEIRIATTAFFWFPFAWNIFSHPFTCSLYVSLGLKWVSCRQQRYGTCFCIHSFSLYLLIGAFNPFTWQPTPVFLPGKSQGWRSLVGYSPWGHKESDMTK